MKKIIGFFLLLWVTMPIQLAAQVNPQKGYIITNENDTVYGTIDYLTDAQNVRACLFQKRGESEYMSLSPADIKGYRMAGDGIYYVSRWFNGEERRELMFAEFLLQGGVSLYRYYYDNYNYFGFVDGDGKEVIIRDDRLNEDLGAYSHKLKERRQKVQEINALMNQDKTIASRLWKMDLTSSDLTKLVKQYDEEYCEEAGECVVFQYDKEKTITVLPRFYAGAGINYASYRSPAYDYGDHFVRYSEYAYTGIAPTFLVGVELRYPRFSRCLNAQVELSYTPHRYRYSEVLSEIAQETSRPRMTLNELASRIGASYTFCPDSRVRPFIKGGFHFSGNFGVKEKNVGYRDLLTKVTEDVPALYGTCDVKHSNATRGGIYLGAGVDISRIRISASWKKAWGGSEGLNEKSCGILTVAYLFM